MAIGMHWISRYLFRGAGFLVAAQIFLTLGLTDDDPIEKLIYAGKLAMFPIPLLVFAGLTTEENGLRAAGFTILFWAGAGVAAFFGAVYGNPDVNAIHGIRIPQATELSLSFGITNLICVIMVGFGVWLWGVKREPPVGNYFSVS